MKDWDYFAPVVFVLECMDEVRYYGHAKPLVDANVVNRGWLPGEPGNAKTIVHIVILDASGNGTVLRPKARVTKHEREFGYVMILKFGDWIHVRKFKPKAQRSTCKAPIPIPSPALSNEEQRILQGFRLMSGEGQGLWLLTADSKIAEHHNKHQDNVIYLSTVRQQCAHNSP